MYKSGTSVGLAKYLEKQQLAMNNSSRPVATQVDGNAETGQPPDGGYGWVCVACCFITNCFSWGIVSVSVHEQLTSSRLTVLVVWSFLVVLSFQRHLREE